MVQKGVFWIMGDTYILVSYNIVYSNMITFIEGLKMEKYTCKNGGQLRGQYYWDWLNMII